MTNKQLKILLIALAIFILLFTNACSNQQQPNGTAVPVAEQNNQGTDPLTAAQQQNSTSELEVKPDQGFLAPNFSFTAANGELTSLSEQKGKPVFINFWASWCGYCKGELPHIEDLYTKYKDDILFLTVNVKDKKTDGEQLIAQLEYTFPVVYDSDNVISELYRVQPIPMNVFIDKNGVIKTRAIGAMTAEDLEQYLINLIK